MMLHLYNLLLPVARAGARLAALWRPKLRAGIAGRQDSEAHLLQQARTVRRPLVWMHSTSVGEYEQARPVARALREARPDVGLLHTFFSPSGFEYARRLAEAEWIDYLPEDTPGRMARTLDGVRPDVLVFLKFDIWPNLVMQASRRHIPLLLLDATLHAGSLRNRWPARSLYASLYDRLSVISAVTETDAARFRRIVPHHAGIVVDGDTRFDQVARRRASSQAVSLPQWFTRPGRPFTLLAGSTWGPDEDVVVPAWARVREQQEAGPACLILVPHEPTEPHLRHLERRLQSRRLSFRRMSSLPGAEGIPAGSDAPGALRDPDAIDVLLVDRVGVLAELYAHADCAYVGGAFTTGVHNVMEPAIAALPVWFGPRHQNAPEAAHLVEAGAAAVVRSPVELAARIQKMRNDPQHRQDTGARARNYVESNLGASQRCVQRILPFLPAPGRSEEAT
jgi:3-deoxy-D-manno-octulosonic-acid transferase